MLRSSISAAIASNVTPASASSIFRARLCDARINAFGPRQSVMLFSEPVSLPVGVELQHRGGSLLDRAPSHVELRPIEFRGKPLGKGDLVGHRLTIDILFVARTGADAEQTILPDLDQPLRRRMQADHQRLGQMLE